jgi:hypothetical protein
LRDGGLFLWFVIYSLFADLKKADFAVHRKVCKKESAEELGSKHEARGAEKEKGEKEKGENIPQSVLLSSRHDPAELLLLKERRTDEQLGVLIRGGEEFDVTPVLLKKEAHNHAEPSHLIQSCSRQSLPLMVSICKKENNVKFNEAAARFLTR